MEIKAYIEIVGKPLYPIDVFLYLLLRMDIKFISMVMDKPKGIDVGRKT